jgi:hypothetical protein
MRAELLAAGSPSKQSAAQVAPHTVFAAFPLLKALSLAAFPHRISAFTDSR